MPITPSKQIWMDGQMVAWDEAKIHVLTHSLHYGSGVFEGVRAYKTPQGVAIFRLEEHTRRLLASAKVLMMDVPYSLEELMEAQLAIVREMTTATRITLAHDVVGELNRLAEQARAA